jgi:arylsulfatase A-like enzyme
MTHPVTSVAQQAAGGAQGDLRLYQAPTDERPPTRADYVRMLESADEGVGQILAALDRNGLARHTLVIFTNDNGGEWLSRNAPFSNRKNTLWEGGIRVPLILRWPGHLPANTTSRQVAITMDLTASILAATKTLPPADYRLDGIDLLPSLSGRAPMVERELFWRLRPRPNTRAVRSGAWKLLQDNNQYYLFDLARDAAEHNDLTVDHVDVVRRLKLALDAWEKDVDARKAP